MAQSSTSRARPAAAKPRKPATLDVEATVVKQSNGLQDVAPEIEAPAVPAKRRPIDLIEGAKRQLKELTGYPIDSVSEFGRRDEHWMLTITVVELNRIPPATDILAEYVVDLDDAGDVNAYRRGRRYYRDTVGDPE